MVKNRAGRNFMDYTYDLSPLYSGFESEEFQSDISRVEALLKEYEQFVQTELGDYNNFEDKLDRLIQYDTTFSTLTRKLFAFISLTRAVDTGNEEANKYQSKVSILLSNATLPFTQAKKYIGKAPNINEMAESDRFKEFKFYLSELKNYTDHLLSDEQEVLISKLKQSSSNEWSNLQSLLTSKLEVELKLEGETKVITASQVRSHLESADREIRRAAFFGNLEASKKVEDAVATALSGIKGEVNTISKMRGFDSPLDEMLNKSRTSRQTVDAMIETMYEYLPHFHKYLRRKAQLLGYEGGLPHFELTAPLGSVEKTFTIEEAKDFVINNFNTFSENLGNLAKKAFDDRWIDVYPRKGKRGGAFCSNIHPIKQSRVMTNFNGSLGDVITIAHELGHAYHGEQIFKQHVLNASYPMPLAETASTLCETIVMNAVINASEGEEKVALIESMLQDQTAVIVDILSRFIFETKVFETRLDHPVSSKECQEIMTEAIHIAYGDGLDPENVNRYAWLNKPHYYSAGLSFYNWPYAFGLLFAKGLYAEYLKDKEAFVGQYDELLAATGKMSVEDVAKLANIDVTQKDFWRSSLDLIKENIDLFLELTEEK
jgi:pepF/M3 family oligoendopeptidase